MSSAVYLETSVLLHLLFREPGYERWFEEVKKADRILTSRLTWIESHRALIRLSLDVGEGTMALADLQRSLSAYFSRMDLFEMTPEICELASRIAPRSRLRTLDAIHLATFHELRKRRSDLSFLSRDDRLVAAL